MCIARVAFLQQGKKMNNSSLLQVNVKNDTKTSDAEIISNIKLLPFDQENRVQSSSLWKEPLVI